LRSLSALGRGDLTPATTIARLFWGLLHQRMGELAMEVLGPSAELVEAAPYELTPLQRLFLFTRADTIYGGSAEIQRNVIGERALGLPSEPRPASVEESS